MSDIFVSYASQDRDRVLPLVQALEKTGWKIFWDRTILAGTIYHQKISAELQACRCVLVVWSQNSVNKGWVIDEAEVGKKKEILVPVLLDQVEQPLGFRTIQAAKLVPWNELIAAIESILGRAPVTPPPPEPPILPNWNQPTAKISLDSLFSLIKKSSALFRWIVAIIVATFIISVIILRALDSAGIYLPVHRIGLIVLVFVSVLVLTISTIFSWFKRRRKNECN